MKNMETCNNCYGTCGICTHPEADFIDECPLDEGGDCLDCEFGKPCGACNGTGLVEMEAIT